MGQFKVNEGVYFLDCLPTFESGALNRNTVTEIASESYRTKKENIHKPNIWLR